MLIIYRKQRLLQHARNLNKKEKTLTKNKKIREENDSYNPEITSRGVEEEKALSKSSESIGCSVLHPKQLKKTNEEQGFKSCVDNILQAVFDAETANVKMVNLVKSATEKFPTEVDNIMEQISVQCPQCNFMVTEEETIDIYWNTVGSAFELGEKSNEAKYFQMTYQRLMKKRKRKGAKKNYYGQ